MPLRDSGTALFAGTAAEFVKMAPESTLTAQLIREAARRHLPITESEERYWRNSLSALVHVVRAAGLATSGVGVELKLPTSSRRIDASFVARDGDSRPHAVIVELKQWLTAAPSPFPEMVRLGTEARLHPSAQVGAYADYLRDSHSAFFATESELAVAQALERRRMTFFPDAACRLNDDGGQRRTREVDFLVIQDGVAGVLVLDGQPHTGRAAQDHARDRGLKRAGLWVIERVPSVEALRNADAVVRRFSEMLRYYRKTA